MRQIQPSVTIFLHHQGQYLFIQRFADRMVDAGRMNGIGGKVGIGEDFLSAARRETEEETGLKLRPQQFKFCGILRTVGGYEQDWLVVFFRAEVASCKLPVGENCQEGVLKWLTPTEFKKQAQQVEVVDDLNFIFPKYIQGDGQFFAVAKLNDQEKVDKIKIEWLKL
jgi:8-oxo-dGTP pyrophosphatase MutT (NUDIX family)